MWSLSFLLLMLMSYFVGAIPFGLLWGRIFADIDIRKHGSGNIGATNMNRILGRKLGAATLASDLLKAGAMVFLAGLILQDLVLSCWVGFAAVLGHCYPVYLGFRGGKGVATSFGALLAISWVAGLIALAVWLLTYRLSKISALGAIVSSACIPAVLYFEKGLKPAFVFFLIAVVIVMRHRENIDRMWRGKELST